MRKLLLIIPLLLIGCSETDELPFTPGIDKYDNFNYFVDGVASPNPCSVETYIAFIVPTSSKGKIFIIGENNRYAELLEDRIYEAGLHLVKWDVRDVWPGRYRCFLEFDDRSFFGDIEVIH